LAIQASKPNNRIFLLLGIVLAALAFGGVLFALRTGGTGQTESIVVAAADVSAGTTLSQADVTTANVPVSAAPQDAYTDPSQVVSKVTTVSITANTPFVPAFFQAAPLTATSTTSSGGTQAIDVETQIVKGYVAVAIPATPPTPPQGNAAGLSGDQVSAAYYIQPGDHIDILVDDGSGGVRYSFQDLIVLRAGTGGTSSSGTPSSYLVEVPRGQAELLTALVTLRGYDSNSSTSGTPAPFVVKYVLRPESEWGKLAPDGISSYAPNYENATNVTPSLPGDTTVTPSLLQSLFGH
jgi:Flp pilus assembly protein CpaB